VNTWGKSVVDAWQDGIRWRLDWPGCLRALAMTVR
jgi:hypothetical protein